MRKLILLATCAISTLLSCGQRPEKYDLCIYGGTSAGVIAAYSAAMQGLDVLLVNPDSQTGGMTSGGLGYTDIGNKQVVTGLSRQFYRKVGEHYGRLEQWIFEPHVAERIFEEYLSHKNISVLREYRLLDIVKNRTRIEGLAVYSASDTINIKADYFMDCTYEGDLMAKSGISYTVGREADEVYGEKYNGVQLMQGHQFPDGISPYKVKNDPSSGLLWGISEQELHPDGTGDNLVQAYNYRICLTDSLANMIPITRPENYDSTKYELLLRLFEAQPEKRKLNNYFIWSRMPNRKTDINNRGGFSTDMIGMNYSYPETTYEQRDSIIKAHTDYTKGLLYFYGHDSRVPEELRKEMLSWGYPKDEYTKNGHWTPQLYIREARRMIGEYVATQKDCDGLTVIEDGIGAAAYNMDSHNCQRIIIKKDGKHMVKNEGNVEIPGGIPYPISYRSLTPKREECTNLLVPVCLSASHIAYGSIRMEPVFMVLGQSAATAIKIASENGCAVQEIDVKRLQKMLSDDPYCGSAHPDILIDDNSKSVSFSEGWKQVRGRLGFGPTYLECRNGASESIEYTVPTNISGKYEIYSYQQMRGKLNPIMNFEVRIGNSVYHSVFDAEDHSIIGQTSGEWFKIGEFDIRKKDQVTVSINIENNNRPSRADAILLIKK